MLLLSLKKVGIMMILTFFISTIYWKFIGKNDLQ